MEPRTNRYVILSCLAAIGIATAVFAVESSVAGFGVTEARLRPGLVNAFVNGYVPLYPSKKEYSAATTAVRVTFVKSTLGWIKTYTESAAFKADYEKRRASARPNPPASKGTPDERLAKQLEEQRKSIAEMKANVAKMSPDMQKQMQPVIEQSERTMEQTSKDPQMMAMMKQAYVHEAESAQQNYQRDLAEHEKKYPADPKILIARRLQDFLNMSKDVAFDAKLVPAGGGMMRFADPSLEAKPDQWKLCYRAGKEPVDAARAFAGEWLAQLGGK